MKKNYFLISIILSIFSFFSLIVSTLAWFVPDSSVSIDDTKGYTASSYFAGGDGSSTSPYLITNPIHFYNLAWLQYLGQFNKIENNQYTQCYFELSNDINMSGLALPPIGTETYPFIGNFNGNGNTITNLVTSNTIGENSITKKPLSINSISGVNIIGVFGVIGNINSILDGATFDTQVISVSDIYLSKTTIKAQLQQTVVGIAAGYVNGTLDNIGVINSNIEVSNISTCYNNICDGGNNISNYTLVGYCENEYKTHSNVSVTSIKSPSVETSSFTLEENEGNANAWGGSIDMKSMYNRLLDINTNYATDKQRGIETQVINVDENGTVSTEETYYNENPAPFKEYYDESNPLKGSYTFSKYNLLFSSDDTSFLCLFGKEEMTMTQISTIDSGLVTYISYQGNYLSVDPSTLTIINTTTQEEATIWLFTGGANHDGTICTIINNKLYYLKIEANGPISSLNISTTSQTWTNQSDKLCFVQKGWFVTNTYSISYNSNNADSPWTSSVKLNSSTSNGTTLELIDIILDEPLKTANTVGNGTFTKDTYFPLNVENDYTPKNTNTGYVISGATYHESGHYPQNSGDIRFSEYGMTSLRNSLNGSAFNTSFSDSKLEIVTRTASSNGFVRISDDYNNSNTSINSNLSSTFPTKTNYEDLGLLKYKKSRDSMSSLLSSSSNVYGLHFMDSEISKDKIVTAPQVKINNFANSESEDKTFTNYQLPEDCIDFNLKEKGFVNFFAGTYFNNILNSDVPTNDSFFTLHTIERDSNNDIVSIKEISEIYGNDDPKSAYIYRFSDGTYSAGSSIPNGYSLIFDSNWIKNPTVVNYSAYYFEIPVNEGEYALGCVPGKTGAYLLYLDIAANAQEVNRTAITEQIITTTDVYEYPLGVSLVSSDTDIVNAIDSAFTAIKSDYVGSVNIERTGNNVNVDASDISKIEGVYVNKTLTLQQKNGPPIDIVSSSTSTTTINRLTLVDYNTTTEETETTTITETTENEYTTRTYIKLDNNGNEIADATDDGSILIDTSGLTQEILVYEYQYSATGTITITYTIDYEYDSDNTDGHYQKITGYTIEVTSNENVNIEVIQLDYGYVIVINGQAISLSDIITIPAS